MRDKSIPVEEAIRGILPFGTPGDTPEPRTDTGLGTEGDESLIIDEFRPQVTSWETRHLCPIRDLYKYKRNVENMGKFYKSAGSTLLYYPTFFLTFYKFLNSLGFASVKYEIEQKMAKEIVGEMWFSPRNFLTYAFIANDKKTQKNTFKLELPRIKLF